MLAFDGRYLLGTFGTLLAVGVTGTLLEASIDAPPRAMQSVRVAAPHELVPGTRTDSPLQNLKVSAKMSRLTRTARNSMHMVAGCRMRAPEPNGALTCKRIHRPGNP